MTDIKRNYSDVMSYSLESPGDDENDQKKLHTKPGRKPIETEPKSKRTAQNRAAQRAYRERKERKMKELEDKVKLLEDENVKAMTETDFLKAQVSILKSELIKYTGSTDLLDLNLPKTVGHLSNPNPSPNPKPSNVSLSPQDNNESSSGTSKGSVSDKASTHSSISNSSPNFSFGTPWSKDNLKIMRQQQQQSHTNPHGNDAGCPDLVSGSSSSTTPLNDNILVTPDGVTDMGTKNDTSLNFTRNFEEEVDPFCVKLGEACGTKKNPIPKARRSIPNDRTQLNPTTESTRFDSPFSLMSPSYPKFSTELHTGDSHDYNDNELFNLNTTDFDFNLVDNKYKDSDDPLSFLNDNNFDVSLAFGNSNNGGGDKDIADLLTTEESMYDPLNKDEVNTDFNFNDFIKNSVTEINGKTGLKESGEPAVAKKEDDGDDDDSSNEVVPAPKATMKCSEIWDRITAHPRYTEIDIDGLCNEMKNKAKCSEKGVVINADDVSLLLERSIRR